MWALYNTHMRGVGVGFVQDPHGGFVQDPHDEGFVQHPHETAVTHLHDTHIYVQYARIYTYMPVYAHIRTYLHVYARIRTHTPHTHVAANDHVALAAEQKRVQSHQYHF